MSMIKEFCEINYQNPSDKSRQQKVFIDNGRNLAVAGVDYQDLREKIMPTLSSKFLEFILVLIYIKFIKKFLICQEGNYISL